MISIGGRYVDNTAIADQWEQRDNNSGPQFVLHDGPPYANGNLHMGS
jgi:isoleucyl-tRNA synthetase